MDKVLKVLFVSNGGKMAPATRYRIYQYLPYLDSLGIDYSVCSIISDKTTLRMIGSSALSGFQRNLYYARVFVERIARFFRIFLLAGRFDIVFLQRTTFPLRLERLLKMKNKNIIFDIDDSIYMPDREEKGLIGWIKRYIKKEEVAAALKISRCVISENNHIKSFVLNYCDNVHIITGPIDTVKNFPKVHKPDGGRLTIGWIGSPSTAIYLSILDDVFRELSGKYDIKVNLIGAGRYLIQGVSVENIAWAEATEVSELHKFDIGVMPMPDNEWTRGKVGCKMLQYMANAIPAVVSYTPTNAEIIEDEVNGFLAYNREDWIKKISMLIENWQTRRDIGNNGRKCIEEKYSVNANIKNFVKILEEVKSA